MNITYRTIRRTSLEGNLCCQSKIDVTKNGEWYFSDIYSCSMPALYLVSQTNNTDDLPMCRQCLEHFMGRLD